MQAHQSHKGREEERQIIREYTRIYANNDRTVGAALRGRPFTAVPARFHAVKNYLDRIYLINRIRVCRTEFTEHTEDGKKAFGRR